ncbi:MAG: hypothetical protein JWM16_6341 [Verrucomicrobiales bacterium]|nr:hypothetical protein [Verrucomicrobiales bacterium]
MIDEVSGEAAAVDTTTTAPEAVVLSQDKAPERNYEAEAADMGWTPKDQWKGNPDNWKDAETYVKHGEDIVRVTKSQLARQEKDFAERLAKIEKVNSKTVEQLEKAHAKELAEARAAKTEAVKAGDVAEVDRLDTVIDDLKNDAPKADKPLTGAALEKHNQKVQTDWVGKQSWWDTDEDMTAYAIGISQNITAKNPTITMEDNLAKVEAALAIKYPEKFGGKTKPAANAHAAVDSGGDFPGAGKADPLAKLPAEARVQAKTDMAKFPKVYPNAQAWLDAYNSK